MQEYVHVLGDAVKQARLDRRLTQFEVAESIHADERTIANIEHYKGNPKLEILWPLLRALGIDANAVFYPEKDRDTSASIQLQLFLSQCTDEELHLLLPICESIIASYRSTQGKEIKKRK